MILKKVITPFELFSIKESLNDLFIGVDDNRKFYTLVGSNIKELNEREAFKLSNMTDVDFNNQINFLLGIDKNEILSEDILQTIRENFDNNDIDQLITEKDEEVEETEEKEVLDIE